MPTMRLTLVALVLLAGCSSPQVVTPSDPVVERPRGDCNLTGRVLSAQGQPITGEVVVELQRLMEPYGEQVLTDGRFSFKELPVGAYRVMVQLPHRAPFPSRWFELQRGKTRTVDIKLPQR